MDAQDLNFLNAEIVFQLQVMNSRAFQHAFRHAYSYDIDTGKLRLLLNQYEHIEANYKKEIQHFLQFLKEDSADSSATYEADDNL
jgi:hypothetical protein